MRFWVWISALWFVLLWVPVAQAQTHDHGSGFDGASPLQLENPGFPNAFYFKPRSNRSMKPVFVYLHGRGDNPEWDCRQWAKVVRKMGWLLCPAGQEVRGLASNAWANDASTAERVAMGALQSLRRKYGRRVQLYGNVLIGFSEGAYVGQNIGVTEMKTFNRWLIMASCDRYFGGNLGLLEQEAKAKKLKRVYLWTGELDGVVSESKAAYEHLHKLGVNVRLNIPQGFWHAIPSETMEQNFKQPLKWLLAAR